MSGGLTPLKTGDGSGGILENNIPGIKGGQKTIFRRQEAQSSEDLDEEEVQVVDDYEADGGASSQHARELIKASSMDSNREVRMGSKQVGKLVGEP